jgi:hypothetical protein
MGVAARICTVIGWLAPAIIAVAGGARAEPEDATGSVWVPLLENGHAWVYSVTDSSGSVVDTLRITAVGGSRASESIYTSIWQLAYSDPDSRPFPIDTDTVFAGCDGERLILQGQNRCCPFLELRWPPVIGHGELPGDTTRIDSIWVAGIEDVSGPSGHFAGCVHAVVRERTGSSPVLHRYWFHVDTGLVQCELIAASAGQRIRRWELIKHSPPEDRKRSP